ncbi:hypothetical protein J3A83DRAFT_4202492 [Scleroderma citrinum]
MESAFVQSDGDVMQKLQAYVRDIPDLLVVGKILIKQANQYRSPGAKGTIAQHLRSSALMTQETWTSNGSGEDEFGRVVVDDHVWFSLSSVEIHLWVRQPGNSKINLDRSDGDGYAVGTLYPSVDLDNVDKVFRRGVNLVKEAIFQELKNAGEGEQLLDDVERWSPPPVFLIPDVLRDVLLFGAWSTGYSRHTQWYKDH